MRPTNPDPAPDAPARFWRRPLDEGRVQGVLGDVIVIAERCKGCEWCVEFCPRDVLRVSERFNAKGYHPPEVAHPADCVDCRLCEAMCPDFAIYLRRDHMESPTR